MFGLISKLSKNISFYKRTAPSAEKAVSPPTSKEIFTIKVHRSEGFWVVTDESRQLRDARIEMDAFSLIEEMREYLGGDSFTLRFAAVPISEASVRLWWSEDIFGGNYYLNESGDELWFSPALFRYLGGAPDSLYLEASK